MALYRILCDKLGNMSKALLLHKEVLQLLPGEIIVLRFMLQAWNVTFALKKSCSNLSGICLKIKKKKKAEFVITKKKVDSCLWLYFLLRFGYWVELLKRVINIVCPFQITPVVPDFPPYISAKPTYHTVPNENLSIRIWQLSVCYSCSLVFLRDS